MKEEYKVEVQTHSPNYAGVDIFTGLPIKRLTMNNDIKEKIKRALINEMGLDRNGGTYWHILTRDKEAYQIGTMGIDDFVEVTEQDIDSLVAAIEKVITTQE